LPGEAEVHSNEEYPVTQTSARKGRNPEILKKLQKNDLTFIRGVVI